MPNLQILFKIVIDNYVIMLYTDCSFELTGGGRGPSLSYMHHTNDVYNSLRINFKPPRNDYIIKSIPIHRRSH